MNHPIQPLIKDEHGTLRFKENSIVRFLLDKGIHNLNDLAVMGFPREDWEQFAQLIGYSHSGAGSLSYVSTEVYEAALNMQKGMAEKDARIAYLENTLDTVRRGIKLIAPAVFDIHPDDLFFMPESEGV